MQDLTTETPAPTKIHLIGGEKGGVGKSMVARLVAQYFIDNALPFVGFDTDRSHGALMRFYAGYASPVTMDRYEALDEIVEAAVEQPDRRVLVDLAAQTDAPLVKWMDDSGVLDMQATGFFTLNYWHVMDNGRDSVDLLARLLDRFGARVNFVLVRNQLRGDDFSQLEKSGLPERVLAMGGQAISIRRLHDVVVQKIDANSTSFWAATNPAPEDRSGLGLMERQRLKTWLAHAYSEFSRVQP